ncbi:MAG: ATP-dependent RecD-like DNA helicase [Opitutae bacterium]|mgnify:FL=1|nr:ATP-dependent RecD-like DNA helicase [Opitutae bacterium]
MPQNSKTGSSDESLEGVLERITFYNEENGYLIGKLRSGEDGQEVTAVGKAPKVQCGETLLLSGTWSTHPKHGRQFGFTKCETKLPASAYGIRKYLGSGLVHGIGKTFANKIVDHFGADTLRIISEESARLFEVPGIGKKRVRSIKEAWDEQKAVREVMMFLQTYGVTDALCLRLVRKYGNEAQTILENEPYRIARDVKGIGFKTADKIALNLGISTNGPERIDAGILHAMDELEGDGHTCSGRQDLIDKAVGVLEVHPAEVSSRLDALKSSADLVECEPEVFQQPSTARAEQVTAQSLGKLLNAPSCLPPILIDKAVDWAQEKAGFGFAPEQAQGLKTALSSKVSILTGGPGTGKTTILQALVAILKAKKVRVQLTAPTGRASRRMAETTSHFSQTVHRLLQFDPSAGGFTANENKPLSCDFVVMDEASMLDVRLAAALMRAIPAQAHLLLVGDADQLPSVGSGNVLKDLIESGQIPVTRLQVTFRQKEDSGIVGTAHGILAGRTACPTPVDDPSLLDPARDVHFVRALDPDACVDAVCRLCRDVLPRKLQLNSFHEVQVLAPLHRGIAGISNLNDKLREALNPKGATHVFGHTLFREGDKVIQTRNNYDKDVFNGDLGTITSVDTMAGSVEVDFEGRAVSFERLEVADLQPAYAISVHKSQGSEYPVVVFPLLKQHYMMLQRNLVYTGLTRAKRKVIFVGDPTAFAMAIRNDKTLARRTDLIRKLEHVLSK